MSPHTHPDGTTWAGQSCQADQERECSWCGQLFADPRPEVIYCSARCERLDNDGDPRWRP